jgi:hypothetical protein
MKIRLRFEPKDFLVGISWKTYTYETIHGKDTVQYVEIYLVPMLLILIRWTKTVGKGLEMDNLTTVLK